MKLRMISLLLAAAMLLGMIVIPAPHAQAVTQVHPHDEENYDHCVCGGAAVATGDHLCEDITWTALPEGTANFGTLSSGSYYLTGDVAVTGAANFGNADGSVIKDIRICLNGYNITSSNTRVFGYILNGSTVSICDCSYDGESFGGTVTAGTGSGKYGGVTYLCSKGILNIYGGNFTGLSTTAASGSVFVAANDDALDYDGNGTADENADMNNPLAASTLNIYNGNIYSSVSTTGSGGVIGTFHAPNVNIHGGKITGGKAGGNGGNISIGSGKLTITGGSISGGYAAVRGGNVYVGASVTLTITGGTITGGEAVTSGSGVYVAKGAVTTVGGSPVIRDNVKANLYLDGYGPKITVDGLNADADIHITLAQQPVVFTTNKDLTAAEQACFTSDSPDAYVELVSGQLKISPYSDEYSETVSSYTWFDNTLDQALPQTVIHKLMTEHFESELPEGKTEKKAIMIGYDGYRVDAMENLPQDESAIFHVAEQGGLYHSFAGGIYGTNKQQATLTAPGWTSITTGYWIDNHGIVNNDYVMNEGLHSFYTQIAEQGYSAALVGNYLSPTVRDDGTYAGWFLRKWAPDVAYQSAKGLDITYADAGEDADNAAKAVELLSQTDAPDLMFAYIEATDKNGHAMGYGNHIPEYVTASQTADALGYDIVQAIEARPTYAQEDWLIIITTDHGGILEDHGMHSSYERSTWISTNKTIDVTDEANLSYDAALIADEEHTHCVCGGWTVGVGDHTACEKVEWTPWSDSSKLPDTSGNYYLTTNVTIASQTIPVDQTISLCLNGHTVTTTGGIWLKSDLNITDCEGTGSIVGKRTGHTAAIYVYERVNLKLYAGTVDGSQTTGQEKGVITLANDDTNGNGTREKCYFTMYGGKLIGRDAGTTYAGAIWNICGQITMYGGTITGGKAPKGGAIYYESGTVGLNLLGGTITGNASDLGAICSAKATTPITVGGDVQITGNTNAAGTEECNIYLLADQTITVSNLSENAKVGVTMARPGIFATGVTSDPGAAIVSDQANLVITYGDGTLTLGEKVHGDHCICGGAAVGVGDHTSCEDVTWTALSTATDLSAVDFGTIPSGYYYLDGDVTVTATTTIGTADGSVERDIVLCLNGHDINTTTTRVFRFLMKDSSVTVCDCSYDARTGTFGGTITGGSSIYGGIIYTCAQSELNIYGGNWTGCGTANTAGGVIVVANDDVKDLNGDGTVNTSDKNMAEAASVLNLYNGNIYGGKSQEGGNIRMFHRSEMNMYGGIITGGNATKNGGNISTDNSVLNLYGGTISDGYAKSDGGNIKTASGAVINMIGSEKSVPVVTGGSAVGISNIYLTGATLNMNGGMVTGGSSTNTWGSVYLNGTSTVNISGDAVIDGSTGGNLMLRNNATVKITDLGENAKISVYHRDAAALIGTTDDASDVHRIYSDRAAYAVTCKNGTLYLKAPQTQVYNGTTAGKTYVTVREAMDGAGDGYVKLLADVAEDVTVSGDLYLDLAGFTLTGNITGTGKLYLMDSATDDFEGDYGKLTGTVEASVETITELDGKTYLTVNQDGVYSAHRYEVKLTHVSLDPNHDALGYKAQFNGDETVRKYVTGFGFNLWVSEDNVKTYTKDGAFTNGQTLTLRLKNIMAANGGEMTINGNAFVTFSLSEDAVTSADHSTTMKQVLQTVDENFDSYTEIQKNAVKAFVTKFETAMSTWSLNNIQAWTNET